MHWHWGMINHGYGAIIQWNYPLKKWNSDSHNLSAGNWPSLKVMRLHHASHIKRTIHVLLIVKSGHLVFYQDFTIPAGFPGHYLR